MAVSLTKEQRDAFNALDDAIKNQDRQAFRASAQNFKALAEDIPCEQSKKAIRVLAVMGVVGDLENARAVYDYLKERINKQGE